MSYIKFVSDIFLGSQELNRFQKFITEDGYVKTFLENSLSFGIIHKDVDDGVWDYFRVQNGVSAGEIVINAGVAIDASGDFIVLPDVSYSLINDNQFYWIKVAHQHDAREIGTVSISRDGTLSGAGTEFLSVLRGIPNNPVKVRFEGASSNTGEYFVQEVTNDNTAILSGIFADEENLRLVVVGAFTPDTVTPQASKEPFQYDGCLVSFVLEGTPNTPPALIDGEEFLVARVRRNGSTIDIEDKRSLNIYRSKEGYEFTYVQPSNNPLIGIESTRFNNNLSPRDQNVVTLGFSFRSSNWTTDSSANRVTLIAGQGGKFKSTSDFTNGDFDGWRIWTKNGKYKIVKQSSVAATQINLILDTLDPDDFIDTTQELVVSPNCEEVEIFARTPIGESKLTEKTFCIPSNTGEVKILLPVYESNSCQYEISYRHKNFKTYSERTLIPDDAVGYFTEAAFDVDGNLIGATKQTYSNGIITLIEALNSYSKRIGSVETGDLFGVEYIPINTAFNPVAVFKVGVRRNYVVITNDTDLDDSDFDFGSQYSLTADAYLDLRTEGAINGNQFLIQFRGDYDLNGFSLNITQDFVNSGDPGFILHTLTLGDIANAKFDNLFFRAKFDGTRWFLQSIKGGNSDTIQFIVDGGGTTITTGQKGHIEVPFDCVVSGWSVFGNQTGNIVVDLWKTNYANFPPNIAHTITGSEKPTISGGTKNENNALSSWVTQLNKGDIIAYNVDSVAAIQRATVVLKVLK